MTITPFTVAADLLDPPPPDTDHTTPHQWLAATLPNYFPHPPAPHHQAFWDWLWAITPGNKPDPFVAIWPRGQGKSTSAEAACVALGARRRRRYGWYVSGVQDQADDHVGNVASMLESRAVEAAYPKMSDRQLSKFGASRAWRRNRLWTAHGFILDAIGLDTAARGVKLEDARPDFLVIDDVDNNHDTLATISKRVDDLTRKILPAGGPDLAVLAIQNLVHPDGVFAQLADGRADFLGARIISGPVPAVHDLTITATPTGPTITGGTPSWPAGMGLEQCQAKLAEWGLTAFLAEAQHEVEPAGGDIFDTITFHRVDHDKIPVDLIRTTVWVDPAVTDTDQSDSMGIQCDALGTDGIVYRLWSWEQRTSPLDALTRAIRAAVRFSADTVGVETDQGGDTWQSVYREAVTVVRRGQDGGPGLGDLWRPPRYRSEKAGSIGSKVSRAQQMLPDYERPDRIRHVINAENTHLVLERALRRFPKSKPYDLCDACYYSWADLRSRTHGRVPRTGAQVANARIG